MAMHQNVGELRLKGARKAIDRVIFLEELELIAAACDDGVVRVYDKNTESGEDRARFEKHQEQESVDKWLEGPVQLGTDIVATCGRDNELLTWRASTGAILDSMKLEIDSVVTSMCKLSDVSFALGTSDGTSLLISHSMGRSLQQSRDIILKLHDDEITDMCTFEDTFLTCSKDGTVKVLNRISLKVVHELNFEGAVYHVTLNQKYVVIVWKMKHEVTHVSVIRNRADDWAFVRFFKTPGLCWTCPTLLNDDIILGASSIGKLYYLSIESRNIKRTQKIASSLQACVVLNDGRIVVSGQRGVCRIVLPVAEMQYAVDDYVRRTYSNQAADLRLHVAVPSPASQPPHLPGPQTQSQARLSPPQENQGRQIAEPTPSQLCFDNQVEHQMTMNSPPRLPPSQAPEPLPPDNNDDNDDDDDDEVVIVAEFRASDAGASSLDGQNQMQGMKRPRSQPANDFARKRKISSMAAASGHAKNTDGHGVMAVDVNFIENQRADDATDDRMVPKNEEKEMEEGEHSNTVQPAYGVDSGRRKVKVEVGCVGAVVYEMQLWKSRRLDKQVLSGLETEEVASAIASYLVNYEGTRLEQYTLLKSALFKAYYDNFVFGDMLVLAENDEEKKHYFNITNEAVGSVVSEGARLCLNLRLKQLMRSWSEV